MCPTCSPWCGCHGNGRCLATAHWIFCSYGRLEAERVNQFWWNLVCNSKLGPQWQSWDQNIKILKIQNGGRPQCWKYIRNAITRLPMDGLGRNLGGRIPSCPRHVRHDAVAMATATAYQRHIEHSAVMGVLRPNAWTNVDDIRNTTARWDRNDSRMIKY